MISKKLSLNKVCIILATTILLLSVVMFSVLYILTKEMSVVFCSMAFCLLFLLCVTVFVILIRRKLTLFSEILCCTLDEMMNGKIDISQVAEEENLFYKINHRLVRLYEVMQESKNSVASERADLQELISDISHQVKTPIANLKMINATLLEQEVPPDKQREFLLASGTQLDKLDFLMQATFLYRYSIRLTNWFLCWTSISTIFNERHSLCFGRRSKSNCQSNYFYRSCFICTCYSDY